TDPAVIEVGGRSCQAQFQCLGSGPPPETHTLDMSVDKGGETDVISHGEFLLKKSRSCVRARDCIPFIFVEVSGGSSSTRKTGVPRNPQPAPQACARCLSDRSGPSLPMRVCASILSPMVPAHPRTHQHVPILCAVFSRPG